MSAVLVLVRYRPGAPPAPGSTPMGRAALALAGEGVEVIFGASSPGGGATGWAARAGAGGERWARVEDAPVVGAHDRFPSQTWGAAYAAATAHLGDLPMGNPMWLTLLCRDKLACQRALEADGVAMPEVEADPARFAQRLAGWGAGFLKPRHGAMGRGVRRVAPGDPLPARGDGAQRAPGGGFVQDDLILQRAVPPPSGVGGLALRALFQREPGGGWHMSPPVARVSDADPVVNVARGARALPADRVCTPSALAQVEAAGQRVCAALSARPGGRTALELGLDFAIDPDDRPHLIEVNSRPRGRLEALAEIEPERFHASHVAACGRPMRYLAWLGAGEPGPE